MLLLHITAHNMEPDMYSKHIFSKTELGHRKVFYYSDKTYCII
jgi:hypothetical protein